jgi:hypothetical protein
LGARSGVRRENPAKVHPKGDALTQAQTLTGLPGERAANLLLAEADRGITRHGASRCDGAVDRRTSSLLEVLTWT